MVADEMVESMNRRRVDLEKSHADPVVAVRRGFRPDDTSRRRKLAFPVTEIESQRDFLGGVEMNGGVDQEPASTHVMNLAVESLAASRDLDGRIELGTGLASRCIEIDQASNARNQSIPLERLEEDLVCTGPNRGGMVFDRIGAGQEHDTGVAPDRMGFETTTDLGTVHVGKMHVCDDDAGRSFVGALKGRGRTVREVHGTTSREKDRSEVAKHRNIVDE